jgi:hypothetical protein
MYTIKLSRATGKKTNDETVQEQIDYIVKRGLTSSRGKGWTFTSSKETPFQDAQGLWVFIYNLSFQKPGSTNQEVEGRQWKEIKEMIAETGKSTKFNKYPWVIADEQTLAAKPGEPFKPVLPPTPKQVQPPKPVDPKVEEPEEVDELVPDVEEVKPIKPIAPTKATAKKTAQLSVHQLKRKLEKLLLRSSSKEILKAMLEIFPWEQVLHSFGSICLQKSHDAQSARKGKWKKTSRGWHGRGRTFFRAMDEKILNRTQGGIFKIYHKDHYECKCGHKFRVDPATCKNYKLDLGQMQYVATCPKCNKQENLQKAKEIFKKLVTTE